MRAEAGRHGYITDKGEGNTGKQEEQDRKWHVHCPVCGSKLGRSKMSDSDIECHKCHRMIGILVTDGMVAVADKTEDRESDSRRRTAAYIERLSQLLGDS